MEILNHIKTVLKHPSILRPYKRIVLLSHMRANTSVFGHILGSNPEIDGYYELHIGYYSWKSLFRQKLKYFAEHKPKSNARYMFDKILHNEHHINTDIFTENDVIIIAIREPLATIKSIQKLYAKVDPLHEYNDEQHAKAYYVARLNELVELGKKLEGQFYYLNADDLVQSPDTVLASLTKNLKLQTPLNKRYQLFKKTGKKGAGDSSNNMAKCELQATIISPVIYTTEAEKSLAKLYQNATDILPSLAIGIIK